MQVAAWCSPIIDFTYCVAVSMHRQRTQASKGHCLVHILCAVGHGHVVRVHAMHVYRWNKRKMYKYSHRRNGKKQAENSKARNSKAPEEAGGNNHRDRKVVDQACNALFGMLPTNSGSCWLFLCSGCWRRCRFYVGIFTHFVHHCDSHPLSLDSRDRWFPLSSWLWDVRTFWMRALTFHKECVHCSFPNESFYLRWFCFWLCVMRMIHTITNYFHPWFIIESCYRWPPIAVTADKSFERKWFALCPSTWAHLAQG